MQEDIEDLDKIEEEEQEKIDKKIKNKKSSIFNIVLIFVICIGLFIYMIKVDGIDNIIKVLISVDYRWVFAGLLCLLTQWFCEALNLHIAIKRMYKDQKLSNSIKVAIIGEMFNNLTPFASGGQPMQALELKKTGKRTSNSMSALSMKFIIYQTALVVSTLVVILLEFNFFMDIIKDYLWIAVLGIVVNIIAILVVLLAGIKKEVIMFITNPIIKLLGKIHIIKNPEQRNEKLNKSIENFSNQFSSMKSEKKMIIKMFLIAIVESFAYYSITYMVYRAFGNNEVSFLQIIPTQALLLLIMLFIPTPGSGLGAEGGFYILFKSIFKEGTINMSILFWRIYTFYLPIIVGTCCLIYNAIKEKNKKI